MFFRNNHFNTLFCHKGQLYLLVTDLGFLWERGVVWEALCSVQGDTHFCNAEFVQVCCFGAVHDGLMEMDAMLVVRLLF